MFQRNSKLRRQGLNPRAVQQLRVRARRAEERLAQTCVIASAQTATLAAITATVQGVKTPNGTTRRIARLLNGAA